MWYTGNRLATCGGLIMNVNTLNSVLENNAWMINTQHVTLVLLVYFGVDDLLSYYQDLVSSAKNLRIKKATFK